MDGRIITFLGVFPFFFPPSWMTSEDAHAFPEGDFGLLCGRGRALMGKPRQEIYGKGKAAPSSRPGCVRCSRIKTRSRKGAISASRERALPYKGHGGTNLQGTPAGPLLCPFVLGGTPQADAQPPNPLSPKGDSMGPCCLQSPPAWAPPKFCISAPSTPHGATAVTTPPGLPSPGAREPHGQRGLVPVWGLKTPPGGEAADGPFTPFLRYQTPGRTWQQLKPHGNLGPRGAGMEEVSAFAPLGIPPRSGSPPW